MLHYSYGLSTNCEGYYIEALHTNTILTNDNNTLLQYPIIQNKLELLYTKLVYVNAKILLSYL